MLYYRCRCGSRASWSSMGVASCETCPECRSTLATGPGLHSEPTEHEWTIVAHGTGDDGQPLTSTRCRGCHRAKREIEAAANTVPQGVAEQQA